MCIRRMKLVFGYISGKSIISLTMLYKGKKMTGGITNKYEITVAITLAGRNGRMAVPQRPDKTGSKEASLTDRCQE